MVHTLSNSWLSSFTPISIITEPGKVWMNSVDQFVLVTNISFRLNRVWIVFVSWEKKSFPTIPVNVLLCLRTASHHPNLFLYLLITSESLCLHFHMLCTHTRKAVSDLNVKIHELFIYNLCNLFECCWNPSISFFKEPIIK